MITLITLVFMLEYLSVNVKSAERYGIENFGEKRCIQHSYRCAVKCIYRRRMKMKKEYEEYEEYEEPECFTPEENNPYPLCVGNGNERCNECCLYVDYPEPPFD